MVKMVKQSLSDQPTVFHITHQKAGSQWVREILKFSVPERFVPQELHNLQLTRHAVQLGKVYAAVYMNRNQFLSLLDPFKTKIAWADFFNTPEVYLQNWFHFTVQKKTCRCVTVIRDLRDTLISLYFSRRYSHPLLTTEHFELRKYLEDAPFDEGLLHLMQTELVSIAQIQTSWIRHPGLLIRYEEFIEDTQDCFHRMVQYCEINISQKELSMIVENNLFENAAGRARGVEEVSSHLRKGISGDWKNHFSPAIIDAFKMRFGETLIQTGYEIDLNW